MLGAVASKDYERARTPARQQERREDIVDAARTLLQRRRALELTLGELAAVVGMSKSSLLRYFETREAVLIELLQREWRSWVDELALRLPDGPSSEREVAAELAAAVAAQPLFCELVSASAVALERHVSLGVVRDYKRTAYDASAAVARLLIRALPGLEEQSATAFAHALTPLVAGVWPLAHPGPTVAELAGEPGFAWAHVDVERSLAVLFEALLHGLPQVQQTRQGQRTRPM